MGNGSNTPRNQRTEEGSDGRRDKPGLWSVLAKVSMAGWGPTVRFAFVSVVVVVVPPGAAALVSGGLTGLWPGL